MSAAVTTAQIFPTVAGGLIPAVLTAPGSGVLNAREFEVAASGYVTTLGAYTVVITLYGKVVNPGTLTLADWTVIGASTARAVGTTSCPWKYRAYLCVDAVSGKVQGEFEASINNLFDARAAVTNVITGVAPASSAVEPMMNFCVGVTFNTGAANIGNCAYFGLEI